MASAAGKSLIAVSFLALAACSGQDFARACEDIEPWRPLIRGAIVEVEPVAAIPFMVTRNIHCSDFMEIQK